MLSTRRYRREPLSALRPPKLDLDLIAAPIIRLEKNKDADWHSPLHVRLHSPDLVDQQLEDLEPTLWSSNVGPTEFLPENEREKYFFDRETRRWYESERHCVEWPFNLRTKSAAAS